MTITGPSFAMPAGACDCHTHVFGDPRRFPFAAARAYTPPEASVADLLAMQQALRLERVVIVQPSVYGTDNDCTLDAMRQLGPRARGVAVIDETTSETQLAAMAASGMRGIRVNLETAGQTDPAASGALLRSVAARLRGGDWHLQIYTRLSVIAALAGELAALPVPLVIDHFGGAQAAAGVQQPGFEALLALVRSGKAYVKLSGAYRSSRRAPRYDDVAPLALALIDAGPERMIWGSDWPHPDSERVPGRGADTVTPFYPIDDGAVLDQLARWAPDPALRRRILVDNPAQLYGF